MKAWKKPKQEKWGMDYRVGLTKEFKKVIKTAIEKIEPFAHKEVSRYTAYFEVKKGGNNLGSGYDTCDNKKCVEAQKKDIRAEFGKGTHIIQEWTANDGDHDSIERCAICEKPLNESLTYAEYELDYLESETWNAEFIKEEAFLIKAILDSTPTHDHEITYYHKTTKGDILKDALQRREDFFKRILKLAESVIKLL